MNLEGKHSGLGQHQLGRWMAYLTLAMVSLTVWGCSGKGGSLSEAFQKTGPVLAKVNGVKITQGEVDSVLNRLPERARIFYQNPQAKHQLIENLVNNEILFQEAERRGIPNKPEVNFQVETAKRSVYAKYLLDELLEEKTKDDVLKAKYESDPKYREAQVHAAHILVKDEKEAQKIYKQLKGGADFAALAKEHSLDPSNKDKGGDLDWFDKSKMVPPFSEAAFALKSPGEITKPVKTNFGYHIIKLVERREQAPFEDMKEMIKRDIARSVQKDILEDLKKNAKVEYLAKSEVGASETTTIPAHAASNENAPPPKTESK